MKVIGSVHWCTVLIIKTAATIKVQHIQGVCLPCAQTLLFLLWHFNNIRCIFISKTSKTMFYKLPAVGVSQISGKNERKIQFYFNFTIAIEHIITKIFGC